MSKATMFVVGILMIAMLVGFGATAAAPTDTDDDLKAEKKGFGSFLEDEGSQAHCHPQWDNAWLVVGSVGGTCPCCTEDCDAPPDYPCMPDKSVRV